MQHPIVHRMIAEERRADMIRAARRRDLAALVARCCPSRLRRLFARRPAEPTAPCGCRPSLEY